MYWPMPCIALHAMLCMANTVVFIGNHLQLVHFAHLCGFINKARFISEKSDHARF